MRSHEESAEKLLHLSQEIAALAEQLRGVTAGGKSAVVEVDPVRFEAAANEAIEIALEACCPSTLVAALKVACGVKSAATAILLGADSSETHMWTERLLNFHRMEAHLDTVMDALEAKA